jgi:membrane protein
MAEAQAQTRPAPRGSVFNPKNLFAVLKETASEFGEDKAPRLSAALAYYTVFSLAPLLVITIAIAGLVFGAQAAQDALDEQIRGLVGQEGADLIQTMVENARQPREGIKATVIGVVTLLFGALGAFGQLQDALNTIWEVAPKPGRGLIGILKDRLAPAGLVLGVGFLLLVSLVLSAGLAAASGLWSGYLENLAVLGQVVNFLVSFLVITLLFAMIFKFLPDAKIAWRDVWIGAALTSLLFTIGKTLIGLYLGSGSVASAYGAAGSLIILLLWVYYSAMILFFGAEFTQVYANRFGSKVQPAENAVRVTEADRAQQGIARPEAVKAAAQAEAAPPNGQGAETPAIAAQADRAPALPPPPRIDYTGALLGFAAGIGAGIIAAMQSARNGAPSPARQRRKRPARRGLLRRE